MRSGQLDGARRFKSTPLQRTVFKMASLSAPPALLRAPSIRKGNARAIETGIKVLDHQAKINGYAAPQRHELTGKDGTPLTLVQLLEAVGPISDEDEN